MAADLLCMEGWCEDVSREACQAFFTGSSLASCATDDWLMSSSSLSLECSEDMAMEDAFDDDEACEEPFACATMPAAATMQLGRNSIDSSKRMYHQEPLFMQDLRELVRSELQTETELYDMRQVMHGNRTANCRNGNDNVSPSSSNNHHHLKQQQQQAYLHRPHPQQLPQDQQQLEQQQLHRSPKESLQGQPDAATAAASAAVPVTATIEMEDAGGRQTVPTITACISSPPAAGCMDSSSSSGDAVHAATATASGNFSRFGSSGNDNGNANSSYCVDPRRPQPRPATMPPSSHQTDPRNLGQAAPPSAAAAAANATATAANAAAATANAAAAAAAELTANRQVVGGWPASALQDRQLLVGWMRELTSAAGMQKETLWGASSLLDRFVAESQATGQTYPPERILQLLALACVSVAMKFEEVTPLPASELLRLAIDPASGTPLYTASDLARMERLLLQCCDWRVRAPTAHSFMQHFLACCCSGSGSGGRFGNSSNGGGGGFAAGGNGVLLARSSSGSSSSGGVEGNNTNADVGSTLWEGDMATAAYGLVDLALLHHAPLRYGHSTTALACLLLAEQATSQQAQQVVGLVTPETSAAAAATASMAAGAVEEPYGPRNAAAGVISPSPAAVAAAAVATVGAGGGVAAAVQLASGMPLDCLAPGLPGCMELLEAAWKATVVAAGPF